MRLMKIYTNSWSANRTTVIHQLREGEEEYRALCGIVGRRGFNTHTFEAEYEGREVTCGRCKQSQRKHKEVTG